MRRELLAAREKRRAVAAAAAAKEKAAHDAAVEAGPDTSHLSQLSLRGFDELRTL